VRPPMMPESESKKRRNCDVKEDWRNANVKKTEEKLMQTEERCEENFFIFTHFNFYQNHEKWKSA
jgi:hypothetical protein